MFAQVPQGIPYQAIARNGQGQALANLPVKVRFSILDSTLAGTTVYSETHEPITSAQGLFSVNVGMGNSTIGSFSSINWGVNAKFLKVELDTTAGGNNYVDLGTQQMMSVPYALYAGQTSNVAQGQSHFRNTLIFYQNDTFVVPPNVTKVYVEAWGGGAGGWGSDSICFDTIPNTQPPYLRKANGNWHGEHGCKESAFLIVSPGEKIPIIIGLGGFGTAVNTVCQNSYGTNNPAALLRYGGNTFFGNQLVAIGGGNSLLLNGNTLACNYFYLEFSHNIIDGESYYGLDGQIPGEGGNSGQEWFYWSCCPGNNFNQNIRFIDGGNGANGMVIVHY